MLLRGGLGGATSGAGGLLTLAGGAAQNGGSAGGNVVLAGGDGNGAGAGGSVDIDGGAGGTGGAINIGVTNAVSVAIGRAAGALSFYDGVLTAKQTVTGAKGGNAALTDLLTKLATLGLIVDGTT